MHICLYIDENHSVRVNWGGYAGVNATIQGTI
jgi:hypothetical protein